MNAKSVRAGCAVLLALGAWACGPPPPKLSISPVAVAEGNAAKASAYFTVTLSPAATSRVTVNFATSSGTATVVDDYSDTSGTLTFATGEAERRIEVAVSGDTLDEPDETFTMTLSEPSGATIATGEATGTITDDDDAPAISAADAVAYGNADMGTTATFAVTLSGPSGRVVTVAYATADGNATAGSDFTAASGTLTFAPGETSRDITVTVLSNELREKDETFTVTLSNASNAGLADASATGTIMHAITLVQGSIPTQVVTSSTGVTATWDQPTEAGNLLIACLSLNWAGAMSITPPPGWIQVLDSSGLSGLSWVRMWYLPDAASRSGAETWFFSNGTPYAGAIAMFEYAGLTANPLDVFATSTGTGTAVSTGTTAATTAPLELWFACVSAESNAPQTAPTNGFAIAQSTAASGAYASSTVWMQRIARSAGPASTGTTLAASGEWSAGVATFK